MNTRVTAVAELERRIGHTFQDRELLERALTHGSVTKGSSRVRDNERLEFLGDRVLNLVTAERIMNLRPDATEGELSKLMNQLVNYHACAEAARRAGLRDAMRVDASATKVGARDNDRVLGDACEALIAALYLDAGIAAARDFILTRGLAVPIYQVIKQEGSAHEPIFTVEVRVPNLAPATARGGSKREAEKLAADVLLTNAMSSPLNDQ